ncbi:MAG: hypothetical protein AVDCRST_MAG88-833 [uncultured Thermomicrobiales bacterium]|uniref:Uncharacterized protein n=1 Tax=uncultured Thermomicrobiales bacterium TaxID=1645740 RepID=A0A6J4UK67_9BACT|nr:MAG: hypothetical protein AVDCRST_MAG88-833 [uncultured Thermomicrobiales bacterium]
MATDCQAILLIARLQGPERGARPAQDRWIMATVLLAHQVSLSINAF